MAFEHRLGHLKIESPIGNAGGLVRSVEDVKKIAKTGVGWIEAGSYTLEPRFFDDEQSQHDYFYDPEAQIAYNAKRMPNPGIYEVKKDITRMRNIAHAAGKPLVVNVALVSDNPAEEAPELAAHANEAGADSVLINPACPSLGNESSLSYDFDMLPTVLASLGPVAAKYDPVFWRPNPADSYEDVRKMMRTMDAAGRVQQIVSTLFISNTWKLNDAERKAVGFDPGLGGKSGPGLKQQARHQLAWARTANLSSFKNKFDLVSSIAIDSGRELAFRTELLGAKAGAITNPLYPVKNWGEVVDKMLREYAEATSLPS